MKHHESISSKHYLQNLWSKNAIALMVPEIQPLKVAKKSVSPLSIYLSIYLYISILRQFTRNGGFWKAPFPTLDQLEIFFAISLAMNERLYKFSKP